MSISMLVPLDGSELAERVIPSATRLARAATGRIVFAHAWDPRARTGYGGYGLDAVAEPVRQEGVTLETCVVDLVPGEESDAIHRATREHRADFIVMSTHGRAGLDPRFRGSILERILLRAEVPVLLVPALQRKPWPQVRSHCILVRLDCSKRVRQAFEPAATLARELAGTLLLLRIFQVTVEEPAESTVPITGSRLTEWPPRPTWRHRRECLGCETFMPVAST